MLCFNATLRKCAFNKLLSAILKLPSSFYVFRSVETGNVCVVYRRNNGGYGLIETE